MSEYDRVYYRGVTLNKRTVAFLETAQEDFGRPFDAIPQGSYHHTVTASAGTHDGGGAIDISDRDLDGVQHVLRKHGGAAWHRYPIPDVWGAHCHCIVIGDKQMSPAAADQVRDYYNHRDGLAGHSYDGTWHPSPIPVFQYHGDHIADRFSRGPVYVAKVHLGQQNSDSVARTQFRLTTWKDLDRGGLAVDGNFGHRTQDALADWQRHFADHGPNDGTELINVQAHRLFGDKKFDVIEDPNPEGDRHQHVRPGEHRKP